MTHSAFCCFIPRDRRCEVVSVSEACFYFLALSIWTFGGVFVCVTRTLGHAVLRTPVTILHDDLVYDSGNAHLRQENKKRRAICSLLHWIVLEPLVSHQTAIGDTIAAIGPFSAIASRGQLELRYPLWLPLSG